MDDRAVDFALVSGPKRLELALVRERADGVRLASRDRVEDLPAEERSLLRSLEAGLSGAGFSGLLARLNRDSLLYTDPDGGRAPSRLDGYYRRNDHSADVWKFVYPQWRCLEEKVRLGSHWTRINYSTLECRLSNPNPETVSLRFFADETGEMGEGGCRNVEEVMTEADVVGGRTQELLGRTLMRAAGDGKPAFIHLNTTCMPELLGDTPMPFLAKVEGEMGVPVFWTSKTRPGGPLYVAWIDRLLDAISFAPKRDPRAVLLAGAASTSAQADAEELLAGLGLRVVGTVFPNLDFRGRPEMGSASAVVWADPLGWETIDDDAFLRRGLAVVRTHPPYGLAGGKAWLERVASVLGLDGAQAAWTRAVEARSAELEEIRALARGRVVALIGDRPDIELLTSGGRAFGFSVAALLGELGLRVRCLVWAPGAQPDALRRPETRSGAGTIEFAPFSTKAGLDRELGRGVDLVFSHVNHDARLRAHAVQGFTESAFEPGLSGFLRSGRRLLDRCAARPFPRHRKFLTPWT